jgi:hypothetical protein
MSSYTTENSSSGSSNPSGSIRMTATNLDEQYLRGEDQESGYRAVSKAALASVVFAILGSFSLWASVFIILPLLGLIFAVIARSNLRRYPEELSGSTPAVIGLILNLLLLVGSIGFHTWVYATEVPEGYNRISFSDLKPKPRESSLPFSPKAKDLDGKKVFLKGWVRPSDKKSGLKKFILVGDFGSCCFGGSPKPTDVVAVEIVTDQTVDYSLMQRKIGGTFRLNTRPVQVGDAEIPALYYQLEADYLK